MKKWVWLGLGLVVVIVIGFFTLQSKDEAPVYTIFEVIEQPIESTVLATGTLTYGDERRIRSEITARVIAVEVEEGDRVELDQVLVRLDRDDFETDVTNQQTNLALRKLDIQRTQLTIKQLSDELARQTQLFKQNATQASTLESIHNEIALANVDLQRQRQLQIQTQHQLDQAQKHLAKTIIRSPMKGLVSALDIKVDETATASGAAVPLMTLVDPNQIYSDVDVDEADIGDVELGLPVRVFAVAYLSVPLDGKVTDIATSARRVEGKNSLVFPVEVKITEQDQVVLRPGMSTRAEIMNRSESDFLVVPIEALQEDEDDSETGYSLFVVESGIARKVSVSVGPQDDRFQAIIHGAALGDQVVIGPYRLLRELEDGTAIQTDSAND